MFQTVQVSYQSILWGFFIGGFGGFIGVALALYLQGEGMDAFERQNDRRREAQRRLEAEKFEKHEEYVYYDASREQSCFYKFLCCPHYGKITSERILYSAPVQTNNEVSFANCLRKMLFPWNKKVEQLDYDYVVDAGVEQSCDQFLTNTGTVILYCSANADVSIVEDEREKLLEALEQRDEQKLKDMIHRASSIPQLSDLIKQATLLVEILVQKRMAACRESGEEFHAIYAHREKVNSNAEIHVRDVYKPYAVLDDISYKISKGGFSFPFYFHTHTHTHTSPRLFPLYIIFIINTFQYLGPLSSLFKAGRSRRPEGLAVEELLPVCCRGCGGGFTCGRCETPLC